MPDNVPMVDDEDVSNKEAEDARPAVAVPVPAVTPRTSAPTQDPHLFTWYPIFALSKWLNGDMDEHVTLIILLPSGITAREDSQVRVGDNLTELIVRVKWPDMAGHVDALHQFFSLQGRPLPPYHPMIVGFHNFFAALRTRESDSLHSEATIQLPMQVQKTPTEFFRIGDANGTRMIYVTLGAVEKTDYKGIDDADFILLGDSGTEKAK